MQGKQRRLNRREYLTASVAGAGVTAASDGSVVTPPSEAENAEFSSYSRYRPSFGGPPGSKDYLGKLTPGLRPSGLEPVPVTTPDLEKIPWKMVNGAKEFHITCQAVRREFLPGYWMDAWAYNGSVPGATIEAYQGDRVRMVVRNELPEPTTVHWHGLELPISEDGIPGVTQDPIPPGGEYVYEFDLHQTGTFFYHSHFAMQEAFGMVGLFIVHPRIAYDPPVDRDFALVFQNFFIPPGQSTPDSMAMDWNWHTINGRSGPYTTPLVCRHGERVRIRIMDFSPMQHHPVHLHGHTFWITGDEGGRIPPDSWRPANTALIGVAMAKDLEFIAFNPGDWMFHCHMVHHMMNHMTRQVGPRIRSDVTTDDFLQSIEKRPAAQLTANDRRFATPGYPQAMQGMSMTQEQMRKINNRREVRGMRAGWHKGVKGLMTVVRVLPDDLYEKVLHGDEELPPGVSVPKRSA